jgi:alpha-mannosidase
MSGVMTDHVYEDTLRSFDFSHRLAEEEVQTRLRSVISMIDTRGNGVPLVVFNTLSWQRTDVVRASVGFSENDVRDLQLVGPDGQGVPVQILASRRHADGTLIQADIAFIAKNIPALGYTVFHAIPVKTPVPVPLSVQGPSQDGSLENEYYRMKVDPSTGALIGLLFKDDNWNVLKGPGNVVAREQDRGDLWELYRPLDGGSRIAMKDKHPPPQPGKAVFSTDQGGKGTTRSGRVVSEFTVTHPFGAKGTFNTSICLFSGLRRIDLRTRIVNQDQFVRYRALFPTSIPKGQNVQEIPFGAMSRPLEIEFPAQNWMDFGDEKRGLALLNRGLPGNNVSEGTMMLSLARSTRIVAYGFGGGYEPGMGSDSGFEMGKELTFDYALVPHRGDWRQAAIYRHGLEFNHPLIAGTAAGLAGVLPARWGFLEISQPHVVVSALKGGPGGTAVLRIYEAMGQAAQGTRIKFTGDLVSAEEVNLMEDPGRKLKFSGNTLQLDLGPFEIKTIKLKIDPFYKVAP